MIQIKTFRHTFTFAYGYFDDEVNKFIADKKVIDIKFDTNHSRLENGEYDGDMTVMVIYEEVEDEI